VIIARRQHLPHLDPVQLRDDLDRVLDPSV
jgi:hypothetical protein